MYRPLCFAVTTIFVFAIIGSANAGELYRWVDKDGKVQYSERPPADSSATQVKVDKPAPTTPQSNTASPGRFGDYRDCKTTKCLADQMERDRLRREEEYSRIIRSEDDDKKKSASTYSNPNLDAHLRERCLDMSLKNVSCNDKNKLRELWGFPKAE